MQKFRLFVLTDTLQRLFNSNELCDFFFKIEALYSFIYNHQDYCDAEVFIDFNAVLEFKDLEIYGAKQVLSYLTDTNSFFTPINGDSCDSRFIYFQVGLFKEGYFKQVTQSDYIHLFETASENNVSVRVISEESNNTTISFCRIDMSNTAANPVINSIVHCEIDSIALDIFFDTNIKGEFDQEVDEYREFKDVYISIYKKFDWESWKPKLNPNPFDSTLAPLRSYHKPIKEDVYLLKWGCIMAVLNGARLNRCITRLNRRDPRVNDVYQLGVKKGKDTLFYSTDTENGNLEIYDFNGIHINKVYGIQAGIRTHVREYTIEVPIGNWLDV